MESGYDKVFHGEISDPICKMEILEQSDRVGSMQASSVLFTISKKKRYLLLKTLFFDCLFQRHRVMGKHFHFDMMGSHQKQQKLQNDPLRLSTEEYAYKIAILLSSNPSYRTCLPQRLHVEIFLIF